MATWWFDLVRFANTVGYHGDQEHRITPYRDYVIKSFNDNLPFDQFTIEQLAGDLLPNPTMWQLVATGYNRILQTTHEGGAQDGEYRAKYLADRVRNFSEVGWPARWAAPNATITSSIRIRRKISTAWPRSSPTSISTARYKRLGTDVTPTQRPPEMLAWTLPIYERDAGSRRQDRRAGSIAGRHAGKRAGKNGATSSCSSRRERRRPGIASSCRR